MKTYIINNGLYGEENEIRFIDSPVPLWSIVDFVKEDERFVDPQGYRRLPRELTRLRHVGEVSSDVILWKGPHGPVGVIVWLEGILADSFGYFGEGPLARRQEVIARLRQEFPELNAT